MSAQAKGGPQARQTHMRSRIRIGKASDKNNVPGAGKQAGDVEQDAVVLFTIVTRAKDVAQRCASRITQSFRCQQIFPTMWGISGRGTCPLAGCLPHSCRCVNGAYFFTMRFSATLLSFLKSVTTSAPRWRSTHSALRSALTLFVMEFTYTQSISAGSSLENGTMATCCTRPRARSRAHVWRFALCCATTAKTRRA